MHTVRIGESTCRDRILIQLSLGNVLRGQWLGDCRCIIDIGNVERKSAGSREAACIRRGDHNIERTDVRVTRNTTEGPRGCVESEPTWQCRTIRQCCGVGQHIAINRIGIGICTLSIFQFRYEPEAN